MEDEAVTTWVKPKLVAEVKFTEWTSAGQMRHPAFLGLREDKNPEDVVLGREARFQVLPSKQPDPSSSSTVTHSRIAPITRCRRPSAGPAKGGGAILGFANFLLRLYETEHPRAVLVGWDTLEEPTYRNAALQAIRAGANSMTSSSISWTSFRSSSRLRLRQRQGRRLRGR